jgi:DNA-binding FadR family transcriptional regulator
MDGAGEPRRGARPATSKLRLHGSIAHDLGVLIVSGRYQPGDLLDTEIVFAEQLKVSRSAYREAVRILSAKGLVESRPKIGTQVSRRSRWNLLDPEVLSWFFESEPSADFLDGLFELRMMIEPEAAGFAALRRTADDLGRMRKALERMAHYGLATEEGRAADRDFHDAVIEATRNPALVALSSSIGAAVRWTTIFKHRKGALPRDPMPEHWTVFDAIAAGDASAAREAMRVLVGEALSATQRALQP